VLLPVSPDTIPASADLQPILALLPANSGFYRASAQPAIGQILDVMNDKLLTRGPSGYRDDRIAPVADVDVQNAGSAMDFDTRIDETPPQQQSQTGALASLRAVLESAHVQSMLVTSTTADAAGDLFIPTHSAVILTAAAPWNADAIQTALTDALRARLTASDHGLIWQQHNEGGTTWYELSGLQPMAFAVKGQGCLLASDGVTLRQMLNSSQKSAGAQRIASTIAGYSHTAEREHFLRLTSILDGKGKSANAGNTPPFFSGNMSSLANTFSSLDAESFTEVPDKDTNTLHQTVRYQWRR
jgi:hypothetical protein